MEKEINNKKRFIKYIIIGAIIVTIAVIGFEVVMVLGTFLFSGAMPGG